MHMLVVRLAPSQLILLARMQDLRNYNELKDGFVHTQSLVRYCSCYGLAASLPRLALACRPEQASLEFTPCTLLSSLFKFKLGSRLELHAHLTRVRLYCRLHLLTRTPLPTLHRSPAVLTV